MEPEFDSSTEYKSAYTWKNKPQDEGMDKYEEAVERMMQAQYINFSPVSTKSKQELDQYEMIVSRKMNEPGPEEYAYQQTAQNPNFEAGSARSSRSSHSHNYDNQQIQQEQYQDRRDNLGSGARSVSSRSSSRSSRSRHSDLGSFQEINDNMSVGSSQNTEIKTGNKSRQKKKKEYDASHLNKSRRSKLAEGSSDNLRPVFFRNPEHATEEEKKYLYGPFYVSWPKNKPMPPQFAELQKVYHNTHYY